MPCERHYLSIPLANTREAVAARCGWYGVTLQRRPRRRERASDMDDLRKVHDELADVQIVDCREQWEWDAGRIVGATLIPLNQIMAGEQGALDPAKKVYVVCRTGNRSELATMMLRARGFDAENMEGGMERWAALGLPFTAPDGSPGRVA
jgi:rhodanese-related sulfurtransferase